MTRTSDTDVEEFLEWHVGQGVYVMVTPDEYDVLRCIEDVYGDVVGALEHMINHVARSLVVEVYQRNSIY